MTAAIVCAQATVSVEPQHVGQDLAETSTSFAGLDMDVVHYQTKLGVGLPTDEDQLAIVEPGLANEYRSGIFIPQQRLRIEIEQLLLPGDRV